MERSRYSGKREIGGRVDLGWGDEDGEGAEETEKLANDVGKQQYWAVSGCGKSGRTGCLLPLPHPHGGDTIGYGNRSPSVWEHMQGLVGHILAWKIVVTCLFIFLPIVHGIRNCYGLPDPSCACVLVAVLLYCYLVCSRHMK
ncbi:hypothetical protein I7I51_03878 [Histoplasma capsulatum]|uniref:Uncharacterized protein n=1 Tax=Ajellomyces capsulatus TaxID=5037 RepID=A0A8A1M6V4_AJECA|nr:hypothetical protein I7I51_03878 [Histoplasma capsulatum]